jgi:predicted porin
MTDPKKLLALTLALSAPLAASAQAEAKPADPWASPVSIYANLNGNLQSTRAQGATNPAQDVKSRWAVSIDSSALGFRGGLKVDEWIGAVYQCETSASVDGISTAALCNRNSMVGVAGQWGRLFYGNWDTPFKAVAYGTKADDPFLNTDVYGFNGIMGSPGFNYRSSGWSTASNTATTGFDVRANNSVAYHSPRWEGVSVKLQYGANELRNASGTQNPELLGAAINFDYGPLSLLAAYERHNDGFALVGINGAVGGAFGSTAANGAGSAAVAISSNDSAWRVGAGYQLDSPFGATTVGGLFEQLTLKQDNAPAGAVTEYKRNAWQLSLKHRIGPHEFRGRYDRANAGSCSLNGAACSTDGYGANQFSLGYAYYVTADFHLYASYTRFNNERNAQYTPSIGGSPAVAGATPRGGDPQALGIGVRYAFQLPLFKS